MLLHGASEALTTRRLPVRHNAAKQSHPTPKSLAKAVRLSSAVAQTVRQYKFGLTGHKWLFESFAEITERRARNKLQPATVIFRSRRAALQRKRPVATGRLAAHQPLYQLPLPGSPLNGPANSGVIHPP